MRACRTLVSFVAIATFVAAGLCVARESKRSGVVRDGSTKERAIVVTERDSKYVHWEYQYLDKKFPGRGFPMQHAEIGDDPTMRAWDLHTFMWRGRKTEVWFDITQPFREFCKAHPKIK
jgi:hypothetical protein